ncbi:hypothetical protein CBW65_21020 [Tumebacillus avium]|uniref:Peptidase M20 n=1 Tax=Tumebacillus avium TaxID=1903704 RepID=A0A1Y0IT69_9BACL|nr:M20/M25/M40 family metallo-hydrolase [Tumebacillus avium]ARU63179.1 hypothetical protein CBW65_21020 [Tumebacillus avium]
MEMWQTKADLTELLCELVRVPSITLTDAEKAVPGLVAEKLGTLAYFQAHREHLQLHPTGDGREFVTALVKKAPDVRETVVLLSHFDVVSVQDYGEWKDMAFDAKELTRFFNEHQEVLPPEVQDDLKSGEWLFGRGTMDMKAGLALQMAMVEQACAGKFAGNVLLLTVPDEEVDSIGMRAAVPAMLKLAEEHGLEYQAVLNSEPMFALPPGDTKKYLYTGTIGKVLPGLYCYGKESHVGEPFRGLNANLMASLATLEVELNADFCERVEGEVTPPPTNLLQKDLRKDYSVQIPSRAVTLFNLFLFERSIDDVMQQLLTAANRAARKIEQHYAERIQHSRQLGSAESGAVSVRVLSYEQLHAYAVQTHGQEVLEQRQAKLAAGRGGMDDRNFSVELVDDLAGLCKELAPMIVVFFTPSFYPAVSSRRHCLVQDVVADVIKRAEDTYGIELEQVHFFPGICDLSYVGLPVPPDAMRPMTANMPLWEKGYQLPLDEMKRLDVPVLNIGPVGKDAHKWTERLELSYSFGTLRELLPLAIEKLLAGK